MDDQVVAGGIRDLVPQARAGLFFDCRSSKKAPHPDAGRSFDDAAGRPRS
jgi:hypothetical protein